LIFEFDIEIEFEFVILYDFYKNTQK